MADNINPLIHIVEGYRLLDAKYKLQREINGQKQPIIPLVDPDKEPTSLDMMKLGYLKNQEERDKQKAEEERLLAEQVKKDENNQQ